MLEPLDEVGDKMLERRPMDTQGATAFAVGLILGGLPALLAIFIRSKVKESPAWHEHKTDWASYGRALTANWKRFAFLVLMMTVMNFISHGTQDLYPTFLQQQRQFTSSQVALTKRLFSR